MHYTGIKQAGSEMNILDCRRVFKPTLLYVQAGYSQCIKYEAKLRQPNATPCNAVYGRSSSSHNLANGRTVTLPVE